jgi:lysophospholipase L1-like esterase
MRRIVRAAVVLAGLLLTCSACTVAPASAVRATSATPNATTSPRSAPSPTATGPGSTVAVIGDSLSRGFDACDHFGDCPAVSWAGGTDPRVDSVATRLGALTDGPVTVHSFARSGADVSDLRRQVQMAVAVHPDLITLLIGANDVCRPTVADMTATSAYGAAISAALQQIGLYAPDAVVLVASVPDVTALVGIAGKDATARFLWARARGCATALLRPGSTAPAAVDRRAAVADRIREYDAVLAARCLALPRCVYDEGALHDYRPDLAQLSALDRFHPSISGLQELSRLEWRALTASTRSRPLLDRR